VNAPNVPYRPVLTDAARPATFDVPSIDEKGEARDVPVAGEHPLTLYVDKQELVTLMTLGGAPEALAIGYLRNQRLVESIDDIVSVQVDWECNACAINTRHGLADLEAKTARRTKTTGCGQGTVFGDLMEEIDSVRLPAGATLSRATLYDLLDRVRLHETIYKQAGAVHGCALATNAPESSQILMFVESMRSRGACGSIASTAATRSSTRPAASRRRWSSRPRRWASRSSSPAPDSRRWATRSRARWASR
jgi:FdhD protein